MSTHPFNVLFLCTGNSARSILAESYLNHIGKGRFNAFSAGSFPKDKVHPLSLEILIAHNIASPTARSKSWDEFAEPGAPHLDLVITVCDNAAGEVCPIWFGSPHKAHWSFPDPAAATGPHAEQFAYFEKVFAHIRFAIDQLVNLPLENLDSKTSQQRISALVGVI